MLDNQSIKKLIHTGNILDIKVIDLVILTNKEFLSIV